MVSAQASTPAAQCKTRGMACMPACLKDAAGTPLCLGTRGACIAPPPLAGCGAACQAATVGLVHTLMNFTYGGLRLLAATNHLDSGGRICSNSKTGAHPW